MCVLCQNMRKMRQLHIRIKLNVYLLVGYHVAAESAVNLCGMRWRSWFEAFLYDMPHKTDMPNWPSSRLSCVVGV